MRSFDELLAETQDAPVAGWDFSWLDRRATEERPTWQYAKHAVLRTQQVASVLDIQTGGGEVFAEILGRSKPRPGVVAATESWPPNLALANEQLQGFGASVVEVADSAALPFQTDAFDLVISRHPTVTRWDEVRRVLRGGGRYLAQHVGPGSNRELTDFLMGPQPVSDLRSPERARREAEAAGLQVAVLREQALRVEFFDTGAVVYFLRKVIWTVPDFDIERYRQRLLDLHELIAQHGSFVSYAQRFLIEAVKPEPRA
jgi:SAM-dependent methyltransferase